MPLYQELQLLVLKSETNYGEDAGPAGANAILAQNVRLRSLVRSRSVIIAGSNESIECQIEATALATFNPFALAAARTPVTVSLVHGTGAGKVCTLSVPNFEIANPDGLGEQDGIVEYTVKGACLPGASGNDQFTLAFT